jgi:hypothetical protein
MFGMVGLVVVGDPSSNLGEATTEGKKIEGKFAAGKGRFSEYFSQIK